MMKATLIALLTLLILTSGCTNVTEQDMELGRKALETGDPSHCAKIGDAMGKDVCYSTLASKNKDKKLCEKIDDSQIKDGCFVSLAMISQDPTVCDGISDEKVAADCTESVKGMSKEVMAALVE
ncbi:MAG: hypothetical protein ABH834_07940 [Candidatus Altiarchaeota archaeon]